MLRHTNGDSTFTRVSEIESLDLASTRGILEIFITRRKCEYLGRSKGANEPDMKDVRREHGLREEIVNLSFKLSNEYFIRCQLA